MIEDLRENYLHAGISREEVLKILGEESEEKLDQAEHSYQYVYHSYRYAYYIGTHGVESWYLSVYFDNEDKLTETEAFPRSD